MNNTNPPKESGNSSLHAKKLKRVIQKTLFLLYARAEDFLDDRCVERVSLTTLSDDIEAQGRSMLESILDLHRYLLVWSLGSVFSVSGIEEPSCFVKHMTLFWESVPNNPMIEISDHRVVLYGNCYVDRRPLSTIGYPTVYSRILFGLSSDNVPVNESILWQELHDDFTSEDEYRKAAQIFFEIIRRKRDDLLSSLSIQAIVDRLLVRAREEEVIERRWVLHLLHDVLRTMRTYEPMMPDEFSYEISHFRGRIKAMAAKEKKGVV